jgi:glucokinase
MMIRSRRENYVNKTPKTCLVGDIGGTNVRLAVADLSGSTPSILAPKSLSRAGHPTFEGVVDQYLEQSGGPIPDAIVVAVAGNGCSTNRCCAARALPMPA